MIRLQPQSVSHTHFYPLMDSGCTQNVTNFMCVGSNGSRKTPGPEPEPHKSPAGGRVEVKRTFVTRLCIKFYFWLKSGEPLSDATKMKYTLIFTSYDGNKAFVSSVRCSDECPRVSLGEIDCTRCDSTSCTRHPGPLDPRRQSKTFISSFIRS